ncbi:MAG TPA: hypothetical protein VFZ21_14550 [Gemmatimonadaceae bacterium]|jgi:hypothetical protein|nr:hypothetical protein [Gemmatimonadaceae bacterium]
MELLRWTIDPQPVVTIGQSEANTNAIFTAVVGATRLPDGRILAGDRGDFTVRLFSPNGKFERAFGRKGSGSSTVAWRVFDRDGATVAVVDLPVHLAVFEIGADYLLGRYLDPEESIPQVRLYRGSTDAVSSPGPSRGTGNRGRNWTEKTRVTPSFQIPHSARLFRCPKRGALRCREFVGGGSSESGGRSTSSAPSRWI